MKIRFLLIAALLGGLMGLSNCKRKPCEDTPPDNVKHLTIGDSMRSKVPHTGFDTLVFTNQYGDTIYLKGKGTEKFTTFEDASTDLNCGHRELYYCDFLSLKYEKDTGLSNTNEAFPIQTILMSADSNGKNDIFRDGHPGGISIPIIGKGFYTDIFYSQLNAEHYNVSIVIGGETYHCVPFYSKLGTNLYYNQYQGIIQFVSDTISWNRIILK